MRTNGWMTLGERTEEARRRSLRIIERGRDPVGVSMKNEETKIEPMVVMADVVQTSILNGVAGDVDREIRAIAKVLPGLTFGEIVQLLDKTHVLVGDSEIGILCVSERDRLKKARKLRKLPKAGTKRALVLDRLAVRPYFQKELKLMGLVKAAEKLLAKGLVYHDSVDGYNLTKVGKKALGLL